MFTFGGSPMWGTGSPDWSTIAAYLQRGFDSDRRGPVCVMNFGESAYVSTQGLIELLGQLQSGNLPNITIFFDGLNDVYTGYQSGQSGVHENLEQIAARLERREQPEAAGLGRLLRSLWFYRLISRQLREFYPGSQPATTIRNYESMGVDAEALSDAIVKTYLSNCNIVGTLAKRYGFESYFFWPPYISIGDKVLTEEEKNLAVSVEPALKKLYLAVYRKMAAPLAGCAGFEPMTHIFDEYAPVVWLDDVHVTPDGNEIIAKRMLQSIKGRGLRTGLSQDETNTNVAAERSRLSVSRIRREARDSKKAAPVARERDRYSYQKGYVEFDIGPEDRVLDIGSGGDPFPLATVLVDGFLASSPTRHESLVTNGKPFVLADVHNLPFADKSFAYVYCGAPTCWRSLRTRWLLVRKS